MASGCSHGELTLPSAFQLFMIMRGTRQQAWVQRISISASGTGPSKPPMSWPVLNIPDRLIVSAMRWFQRIVCQLVLLSPLQVCA